MKFGSFLTPDMASPISTSWTDPKQHRKAVAIPQWCRRFRRDYEYENKFWFRTAWIPPSRNSEWLRSAWWLRCRLGNERNKLPYLVIYFILIHFKYAIITLWCNITHKYWYLKNSSEFHPFRTDFALADFGFRISDPHRNWKWPFFSSACIQNWRSRYSVTMRIWNPSIPQFRI